MIQSHGPKPSGRPLKRPQTCSITESISFQAAATHSNILLLKTQSNQIILPFKPETFPPAVMTIETKHNQRTACQTHFHIVFYQQQNSTPSKVHSTIRPLFRMPQSEPTPFRKQQTQMTSLLNTVFNSKSKRNKAYW